VIEIKKESVQMAYLLWGGVCVLKAL